MLPINDQSDPVVLILQLAYRRGLALLQEREKGKPTNQEPITNKKPIVKLDNSEIKESKV